MTFTGFNENMNLLGPEQKNNMLEGYRKAVDEYVATGEGIVTVWEYLCTMYDEWTAVAKLEEVIILRTEGTRQEG
jgi:hypothetical protein